MSFFSKFSDFITSPVGNALTNRPEDVRRVKQNFKTLGMFEEDADNGYITRGLDSTIKSFQRDNDLKVDGKINPRGETESRIFDMLEGGLKEGSATAKAKPAVRPLMTAMAGKSTAKNTKMPQADATGRMIRPVTPPMPERKPEMIPAKNSIFQKLRENLAPREGGIADRPNSVDPGGLTNKGISQRFLDNLNARNPDLGLPKSPTDLTDTQINGIFKKEFFERPQIDKLNNVAGEDKTNSKLVEHVFDAGIMTKGTTVGKWLQEAIDETVSTDLKENINGTKEYDGVLGSKTRKALEKAVEQGKVKEINERFSNKRIEFLRNLRNYEQNKNGWEERVRMLRD